MATHTDYFNLEKPESYENYNIEVFNDNADTIDLQMHNNQVSAAKVMVGATSLADGESGRVPTPHAGDEDKYLKGDGTWAEAGSSNVEANPSGTPTDTLETIGINNVIYQLPGGGDTYGSLKGLDYENAIDLTLPDFAGYDYTPNDDGVFLATSYGSVGCIIISNQDENDKYLTFNHDVWTTTWIPITKNATYTLKRGSSSADYPIGSYIWFVPWLVSPNTAITTTYDNLDSGLDADNVQDAIDIIVQEVKDFENIDITITPTWNTRARIVEDGSIIASGDSFSYTDKIDIVDAQTQMAKGVKSYNATSMPSIHYYDENDVHLGYVYADDDYNMSDDIKMYRPKYIRISHYADSLHPFNGVSVVFKQDGKVQKTTRSEQYINILEGHTGSKNGTYLGNNGQPIIHPNWCSLMDYVPVEEEETYTIGFEGQINAWLQYLVAYYDSDKTYINSYNGIDNTSFTTPSDCAYIRISIVNTNYTVNGYDNFDTAYIEKVPDGTFLVAVPNKKYDKNVYPLTTLSGKKWVMFGDSITENNVRSNANYHDYIRSETGIITINNALGGSGYKSRDDNNNAFYQLAIKSVSTWQDADVITVMGGVNDMWSQIDTYGLGNPDDTFVVPQDITTYTDNTIMACFNYLLDYIIDHAPDAKIAVISPLPCKTTQGGRLYEEVPYDDTCNMAKFVTACKKSCEMHGIPYLDLFHNSGLRPWDANFNAKYFKCISVDSPDGLHPNEYGHKYFYPMVREFIKSLI